MGGFLRRNFSESSWTARQPKSEQRANSWLVMPVTSRNGSYISFKEAAKIHTFDDLCTHMASSQCCVSTVCPLL